MEMLYTYHDVELFYSEMEKPHDEAADGESMRDDQHLVAICGRGCAYCGDDGGSGCACCGGSGGGTASGTRGVRLSFPCETLAVPLPHHRFEEVGGSIIAVRRTLPTFISIVKPPMPPPQLHLILDVPIS